MKNKFFLNYTLFWSFWAHLLFIFGMIGYLFMDILDYMHSNLFNSFLTNLIYILLACLFVINATLQFFVIYYMNKNVQRYYTMILSCLFDKIASHAYLIGAILTTITSTKVTTIWTLNTIGVCGFVIGATINTMISAANAMSIWADYFNLLGSLFYLLATIITRIPLTQLIGILGDVIYLIDSILYMICWFQDRQMIHDQFGQYVSLK
ncbi:hypothetical protein I4U23_014634 [Adineta vaga]|nr:hypothetical protein I4U23_014634 [Adineta vaga]